MNRFVQRVVRAARLAGVGTLFGCACSSAGAGQAPGGGSASTTPNAATPGGSGGGTSASTEVKKGVATFYDATGEGNCSFDATPNDLDVAAMGFADYAGSAMCGACLRVSGPKGEVTVRMVDSCPGCEVGHLDLAKEAFPKIANPVDGIVPITYQVVPCDVSGPISYRFKDGSSKWWTAIQILNHRVPIAKLEYKKNGTYVPIRREDYNYFVVDDGVGDQPGGLTVRVTSADGQVLEDTLTGDLGSTATVQGRQQFK